ncbi:hypothetical protein BT69DRAFT_1367970 [Atractiella rhizophila]|nr:hypothetical protein BT69DRAFT_1367970 [Atractiella rhizophila]
MKRHRPKSGTVAAAKELMSRSSLRPEKVSPLSAGWNVQISTICIAADPLHVFGGLYKDHVMYAMKARNLSTVLYLIVGMIGILLAEVEQEAVPALRDLVAFEVIIKVHVQDKDRILVLQQEKLTAVERALKTLSEHFGMSTKFPKGHLPQHFVDLIAKGGTLDHQTTAHGEGSHHPLKEHIIARVHHSNIAGETELSNADLWHDPVLDGSTAFEMMQLQAIGRRIEAAKLAQGSSCENERAIPRPIECSGLCGESRTFHVQTYFDKLSTEFETHPDLATDLRLFLLQPLDPSAPTQVQDFTLFRCPFTSFVDQRIYEDYLPCHPNWQKKARDTTTLFCKIRILIDVSCNGRDHHQATARTESFESSVASTTATAREDRDGEWDWRTNGRLHQTATLRLFALASTTIDAPDCPNGGLVYSRKSGPSDRHHLSHYEPGPTCLQNHK